MDAEEVNISSGPAEFDSCVSSSASRYVFVVWFSVYLLFLPLFLFVLYIGFNKWKKPHSSASGGLSHSDVFTLNMVMMEMVCMVGSGVILRGYFTLNRILLNVGGNTFFAVFTGQTLFHSLTCVERYLAVVHPVTYLRLRGEGGVIIRNISIALVWIGSVAYNVPSGIVNSSVLYGISGFVASFMPLPLVAYCSIYVLCVLIRPKPGEVCRKQVAQSKRSTIYTVVAVLGALLLRLSISVVSNCIIFSKINSCLSSAVTFWFFLPSSLVLPLLFLHRAGKLRRVRK